MLRIVSKLRLWHFVLLAMAGVIVAALATHARLFTVQTGSMRPTLGVYSLVVVVPQARYQPSDTITFNTKQAGVVTHRLIEVKPNGDMVTKGDFNKTADTWTVHQNDIIGKQVGPAIPRLGAWFDEGFWQWKIRQPQFWGGMLASLAGLVLYLLYGKENGNTVGRHRRPKENVQQSATAAI